MARPEDEREGRARRAGGDLIGRLGRMVGLHRATPTG